MVLDDSLLNTQHYKVRIKGKVEQSREGVAPSPTPWCSSYRKGSLRVTLDYGRQLYIYIYIKIIVLTVKKPRQVIWRWKYTTNHYQVEKIYIGKKGKSQTCHTHWKKSKDTQLVGQKKKRLLSNAKSAQYWVEQNSIDNYLVSQELTYYSFA